MKLDHFAVAGATLEEAVAHVEEALGVSMGSGGRHPRYATHNRLIGLEGGVYLEAIAVDPAAAPQEQPRWFALDQFQGSARLRNWILRAGDLTQERALLPDHAQRIVEMQRGDLRWLMTVPSDGVLPFDNLFPAVLQWQCTPPVGGMTPSGCQVERLLLTHPENKEFGRLVAKLTGDERIIVEAGEPAMRIEIMTPSGLRVLT
ncbi:VOC family protein [Tropicibacter sp. Alg240-R139]|uniref:VOC family protein n=1 Tax=Tropicibacter sp. Alg240-R139 TaxID=2305991 RepID=UPI0013DF9790|nr:VOC family protein [Tropicibacter sp. Alg240-R139]